RRHVRFNVCFKAVLVLVDVERKHLLDGFPIDLFLERRNVVVRHKASPLCPSAVQGRRERMLVVALRPLSRLASGERGFSRNRQGTRRRPLPWNSSRS